MLKIHHKFKLEAHGRQCVWYNVTADARVLYDEAAVRKDTIKGTPV